VAVTSLVAEPSVVDGLRVDTEESHDPVRRALERAAAADRARLARRLYRLQVPRSCAEPVRRCGQRADRTDLHRVAGEIRRELLRRVRDDLGEATATAEIDEWFADDFCSEARASSALDTAFTVEEHEVADRDRLLEVPLLFDEARLARTESERLVLQ